MKIRVMMLSLKKDNKKMVVRTVPAKNNPRTAIKSVQNVSIK